LSIYKHILLNIVDNDNFVVFVNSNNVKNAVIELGVNELNIVVVDLLNI
jgi:hypothetical protein